MKTIICQTTSTTAEGMLRIISFAEFRIESLQREAMLISAERERGWREIAQSKKADARQLEQQIIGLLRLCSSNGG